MLTPEHLEQYQAEGYFIVDDAVAPEMLAPLLAASRRVKEKGLSIEECYPPNAKVLKMYEDFKKGQG